MKLGLLTMAALVTGISGAQAQLPPLPPLAPSTGQFATGQNSPKIIDAQGNYRGNLNNNQFDPNSVSNQFGRYGSPFSPDSVNNPYRRW